MDHRAHEQLPEPDEVEVLPPILDAATSGKLAFFVGNGISRLYGLPSWEELSNRMFSLLAKHSLMTYSQAELLKPESLKTRVSIADYYFKKFRNDPKYPDLSYSSLLHLKSAEEKLREIAAYSAIARFNSKFFTTNYDLLFETALTSSRASGLTVEVARPGGSGIEQSGSQLVGLRSPAKIMIDPLEFRSPHLLDSGTLFHLHGSIKEEKSIVASTSDYLRIYRDENLQTFLRGFFNDYTVVFIGYGLDELELLDLIVRSARYEKNANRFSRCFLLLPLYTHQLQILDHLSIYYRDQLGIDLVPIKKDKHGYKSFSKLLESWAPILERESKNSSRIEAMAKMNRLMAEHRGAPNAN